MKPFTLQILVMTCISTAYACLSYAIHVEYLPRQFTVYQNKEGTIQQTPDVGFVEKIIPNVNLFKDVPGCYIACYSSSQDKSVYSVSPDSYLVGQIRVKGKYQGKVCYPDNITQPNFSKEPKLTALCSKTFKCIGNSCWAGGTTGQWFGLK